MTSLSYSDNSAMNSETWTPIVLHKIKPIDPASLTKGPTSLIKSEIITKTRITGNKIQKQSLNINQWKTLNVAEDASDAKLAVPTVNKTLGIKISQARANKNWKRQQLAQSVNVKESEIANWENGIAVFNQGMLNKINRALGTKLKKDD